MILDFNEAFNPFSPSHTGNATVCYERLLKENLFLEGRLSIVGAGIDINQQKGSFLKAGKKFKVDLIAWQKACAPPIS